MIVTCESCKTKFRLDPSRLKGGGAKVRCSRCKHVFTVDLPEEDDLLHMGIPDNSVAEEKERRLASPMPKPMSISRGRKRFDASRALIWIAALVLVGGGLLWFLTHRNTVSSGPEQQAKSSSTEAEKPAVSIQSSTQAYFLENTHAGQIFVVEGEILNESRKPVSFILLEGKLYTTNNQVAQSQRCYSGNVMTRDELARLNVTEIQNRMMNREGKNLMNVHIPTSNRIPFMLVFHNLPELDALSDYSIEVISAQTD